MKKEKEFMTITNKDIYEIVVKVQATLAEVKGHVEKTNGRVSKLEAKSIGLWVSNHPYQFAVYLVIGLSLLSNEARDTVFNLAKSLI